MLINIVTTFLLLSHNQISQGCLNKSSISLPIGLVIGNPKQDISLHRHGSTFTYTSGTFALLNICTHPQACSPRACAYVSGKALVPVV